MMTRRLRVLTALAGLLVVTAVDRVAVGGSGSSRPNVTVAGAGFVSGRLQKPPIVAAASDLQFALKEVAARFEQAEGARVEIVFGSSGNLARQIRDGAPFELFFSADEAFVGDLHKAGLTLDAGDLYAVGQLALFAPKGSPLKVDPDLAGLAALLKQGRPMRFAIANPEHAPYGRAAEAVLRKRGLWEPLQPYLVLGENISQAGQFATTGNAVGGIIAHSLALAPTFRDRGSFALLRETDHPPLRQRMVRLKRAGPTAERFYRYVQGPDAKTTLTRYGFMMPTN
jgi:molybdate transport system substrate-binding protein